MRPFRPRFGLGAQRSICQVSRCTKTLNYPQEQFRGMFWGMSKEHTLFGAYLTSTGFLPLWFAGSEHLEITAECIVWPQYFRSPCRSFWSEVVAQGTLKRGDLSRTRWRRPSGLPVRGGAPHPFQGLPVQFPPACQWRPVAHNAHCLSCLCPRGTWGQGTWIWVASWVEWGVNTSLELQLPFSLGRVLGYSFLLFLTYNTELG